MLKWTDDEIKILLSNWKTLLSSELCSLLPHRSRYAITRKLKRLGVNLSSDDLTWRRKRARTLVDNDKICKVDQKITLEGLPNGSLQVILGSMLGDGSVNKQSKNLRNHRFTEGHSIKQSDYLVWKSGILSTFKPRVYKQSTKINLVTLVHPIFTLLRDKFYEKPYRCLKSKIPIDLVDKVDLFGLMIWYLDDGNMGSTPSIGAKGWNENDLVRFVDLLNVKFSLSMYVYKCRHYKEQNKVIKIPFKDRWIFKEWEKLSVKYNVPQAMNYKFEFKKN